MTWQPETAGIKKYLIMTEGSGNTITYSIWDPTGNITALVESPVDVERQPQVAAAVMSRHPEVEQVGFVKAGEGGRRTAGWENVSSGRSVVSDADEPGGACIDTELRMAGGEFCGNASMCAAAWYLSREEKIYFGGQVCAATILEALGGLPAQQPEKVTLKVSGADEPVEVRLQKNSESSVTSPESAETLTGYAGEVLMPSVRGISESPCSFNGEVLMPRVLGISEHDFVFGDLKASLPVVGMEGISHIIIEPESEFSALASDRAAAEEAVRLWCGELGTDGLGLMFVRGDKEKGALTLTPLVYVPGSGTTFWENSCASGTTAAGCYLGKKRGAPVDLTFEEPGGFLRVIIDAAGRARLCGKVSLIRRETLAFSSECWPAGYCSSK